MSGTTGFLRAEQASPRGLFLGWGPAWLEGSPLNLLPWQAPELGGRGPVGDGAEGDWISALCFPRGRPGQVHVTAFSVGPGSSPLSHLSSTLALSHGPQDSCESLPPLLSAPEKASARREAARGPLGNGEGGPRPDGSQTPSHRLPSRLRNTGLVLAVPEAEGELSQQRVLNPSPRTPPPTAGGPGGLAEG